MNEKNYADRSNDPHGDIRVSYSESGPDVLIFSSNPNWEWCMMGQWDTVRFAVTLPKPPNWFQRFLLKHLLGVHWRPVQESK